MESYFSQGDHGCAHTGSGFIQIFILPFESAPIIFLQTRMYP